MTVSEPSGITETLAGSFEGPHAELLSVAIGRTPGARNVTATARRLSLEGDRLVLEVDVAMDGAELAPHTRSVLYRQQQE